MSFSIFLFGDSIAFGQLVSPHNTWAVRFSRFIAETFEDDRIILNNASINGNTTRQALERMPYDIQSHHPDYVLVQFGMNDCNYWKTDNGVPRVSRDAFSANMKEIAQRALIFGAKKVLFLTTHPTPLDRKFDWADVSYEESRIAYSQATRQACAELMEAGKDVCLVDVEQRFYQDFEKHMTKSDNYLLEDCIHLNTRGHDLYFDIVSNSFKRVLEGEA